ncbi:hypothetical protein [Ectobacillus panaciterrae]|uniref:hypothetical protein n=1 Tax=Ectobacillus panaciterrae TaxID=363872 RepID=UPI0004202B7F|nr:hypothetical protein [Ectobacillus panaciterrae]
MNEILHQTYIDLKFDDHLSAMFADIILRDTVLTQVFLYIGRELNKQYKDHNQMIGITVNEVIENVVLDRLTRKPKGKTFVFEQSHTNISRKAAEKCVDKLLDMSLLYEKPKKPYKYIYLTVRGQQVLLSLSKKTNQ